MHKLLTSQLKRHGVDGTAVPSGLLAAIDDAYRQADEDRILLERSLELTSQELLARHSQLRRDVAERAQQERLQRQRADRLRLQNEAMVELTKSSRLTEGDLPGAIRVIVELGARYLDIARMSVWFFDDAQSQMECADLYRLHSNAHTHGLKVVMSEFPTYFHALERQRTIAADDANSHPNTIEFADNHLLPNGVTSRLDSSIRRGRRIVGVLSCEHVGPMRCWSPEEELFVASLADIVALAMEVAERRRAETELEHSLSLLRTIFESIGDGIVAVDRDGRITNYNKRFIDMWGLPEELVASGDTSSLRELAMRKVREPDGFIAKIRYLYDTPDAESFDVVEFVDGRVYERISRPQRIGDQSSGRVWSFRDVTESRRAQDELLRAKRLEAAGQLAGQIAHDFNNLLTPLVAYPDLMRRLFPVNEQTERILHEMEQSANQIVDINQQLLTLGRRGHFHIEPFDPNELADAAIRTLEIPDGITIDRGFAPDLMRVRGGSAQIMRVLTNLIANAIDAMNGFGTLRIATRNVSLKGSLRRHANVVAGDYICLSVADSGPGIPIEIQEKIFEPFFSTKTADKKRGSGLGLSVVHSVLEDHHGYIDLASEPGHGTTFCLYLPVDHSPRSAVPSRDAILDGNGATVLVVDDDPVQREVITMMLESLGYTPTAVESGERAVSHLRCSESDLVILDMVMGGIDGTEALRQIKIIRPEQRAIILSGFASSDRVDEALRLGARSFVAKPVQTATLAMAIQDALCTMAVIS